MFCKKKRGYAVGFISVFCDGSQIIQQETSEIVYVLLKEILRLLCNKILVYQKKLPREVVSSF